MFAIGCCGRNALLFVMLLVRLGSPVDSSVELQLPNYSGQVLLIVCNCFYVLVVIRLVCLLLKAGHQKLKKNQPTVGAAVLLNYSSVCRLLQCLHTRMTTTSSSSLLLLCLALDSLESQYIPYRK
jgi:hypothetical protein